MPGVIQFTNPVVCVNYNKIQIKKGYILAISRHPKLNLLKHWGRREGGGGGSSGDKPIKWKENINKKVKIIQNKIISINLLY